MQEKLTRYQLPTGFAEKYLTGDVRFYRIAWGPEVLGTNVPGPGLQLNTMVLANNVKAMKEAFGEPNFCYQGKRWKSCWALAWEGIMVIVETAPHHGSSYIMLVEDVPGNASPLNNSPAFWADFCTALIERLRQTRSGAKTWAYIEERISTL